MSDLWYMLQQEDRYLYHYTRAETLVNYILPSDSLRFSKFQNVNDPRESKDWVFGYHSRYHDLGFDTSSLGVDLNRYLKHSWRIGCFVSDPYEALVTREREDKGEDILSAAYERGHSRPRMWAQYAENYGGACLVFDREKLSASIDSCSKESAGGVFHGHVEYRNPRVVPKLDGKDALIVSIDKIKQLGFKKAMDGHISEHWRELFFVKSRDWEAEREYRWLIRGDGDEDFFGGIRESLVGLALGDRFPDELKDDVASYVKENPTVSLAVMAWQNGVPQPQPTPWRLLC